MSEKFDTFLSAADLGGSDNYLKNMDELVNCKIVMGMKKAIQLIFDKFDILCQQKVKDMVKNEIDVRIKELREVSREMNGYQTAQSFKTRCKIPTSPKKKKNSAKRLKK